MTAFVRTADDIADHPTLRAGEKLAYLDLLEGELQNAANRRRRRLSHVAVWAIRSHPLPPRVVVEEGGWPSSGPQTGPWLGVRPK